MIEKLLAKVAHLRALAARAGTQAEAEAAAAAADRILVEHRLTEADLGAAQEERPESDVLCDMGSRCVSWQARLAFRLARHYGCYTFLRTERQAYRVSNTTMPIYGRKSDVEIVKYMYAWLTLEIDRLAQREQGKAAKNSFRHGAVDGYTEALAASKRTAEANHAATRGQSAALVLASRYDEAKAAATAVVGKTGKASLGGASDFSSYSRGREAGAGLGKNALPQGVKGLLK